MNTLAHAAQGPGRRISLLRLLAVALSGAAIAVGCGSSATSASSATASASSSGTPNAYTAVYKAMSFGSTVTVSFPSACEMTLTTSGKPDYTPNLTTSPRPTWARRRWPTPPSPTCLWPSSPTQA